MYNIIKNVIATKRYDLADMLKKIDTLWIQGSITKENRDDLISDTQENAKAENSVDVLAKLAELDRRISALEKAANDNAGSEPGEGDDVTISYPEYVPGKWYYNGDVVMFEGDYYVCTAPIDFACVWSPSEYPTFWSKIDLSEEPEEEIEDPDNPSTEG